MTSQPKSKISELESCIRALKHNHGVLIAEKEAKVKELEEKCDHYIESAANFEMELFSANKKVQELQALLEKAREALEPFAEMSGIEVTAIWSSGVRSEFGSRQVKHKWLLKAKQALANYKSQIGEKV